MRIGPIILRLRAANTRFGNNIGGSAELDTARNNTLKADVAFVVPINDTVEPNLNDADTGQSVTERFAVIVALANDTSQKEKTGVLAYDLLHDIRSQLFRAILGWGIKGSDSLIEYAGGQLLNVHAAYVWYQFDFEFKQRLVGFDGYSDLEGSEIVDSSGSPTSGEFEDRKQVSQLDALEEIYTDYLLSPDSSIPYSGDLPLDTGVPDMSQIINLDDDPNPGGYDRGFAGGFDFYRILNRKNDPK